MKMKWQLIIVLAALIVLVSTVTVYLVVFDREVPTSTEGWWFEIVNGTGESRVSISEFRELPSVERNISLKGTGEDGKEHAYRGISLSYILDRWGNDDISTLKVEAVDFYSYKLSAGDIRKSDSLMIAVEKDGEPLEGRENGGMGPARLLLPQEFVGEYNAQYCVKYVYRIVLE